jgi:hypothetical protein
MRGREPQHLDINVPHTRSEVERIAAVLARVGDHLDIALSRRHFRTRDELVGRAHGSRLLRCIQGQSGKEQK